MGMQELRPWFKHFSSRLCLSVVLPVVFVLVVVLNVNTFVRFRCPSRGDTFDMIPPSPSTRKPQGPEAEDPSEKLTTKHFIAPLFHPKDIHNKFFVEAGALDGQFYSKTRYLEDAYGWTGLLVEPNPHMFIKLKDQGRNAWLAPNCLSPEDKMVHEVMEYPYDPKDPLASVGGGISKVNGKIKWMFNGSKIHSALVKCYPLHTLLDALNVETVHYFSLDVEGVELKVLMTIPFHRIQFHVIEVEYLWNDEGKVPLKDFLLSKGFELLSENHSDTYIFANMTALKGS